MISSNDKKDYYDKYWLNHETRLNEHEILRLAEIYKALASVVKSFDKSSDLDICDLGCGRGWLSHELSKFGTVTGVDLSEKGIELAQKKWRDVSNFEVHDILNWRPNNKYDIVISSEVIEHIQQKEMYVETIRNILKPNGILILTTPNGRVRGNWDKAGMGTQIIEEWLTPKELKNLFNESMELILLKTFIFDFCYNGIYRIMSAPKLLNFIDIFGLLPLYDVLRRMANLGLYQIYIARLKVS